MNHRECISSLSRLLLKSGDPADYFSGKRRRREEAPDNILAFMRRKGDPQTLGREAAFHERWVLIVALSGSGAVEVDRRFFKIREGMAFLVTPLRLHAFREMDKRIRWLFVTFEWPGHSTDAERWDAPRVAGRQFLEKLLSAVRGLSDRHCGGSIVSAYLLEALRSFNQHDHTPLENESLLEKVRRFSTKSAGLRVDELATLLGMSESHLRARFRTECGISLGSHLREARIRKAALSLRQGTANVTQAAGIAGYPDIFSFSRAFRKVMGAPPAAFKPRP